MAELPLNKPAGVLVKTSLVDYPGHVAGVFFLKGCNIRCPYCYNVGLVLENEPEDNLNTVQELFDHLEKRKGILSGMVISGGEPLINPYTPLIIKKAKESGYSVKIDTNGILPQRIKALLEKDELRPDFIAMDIKTTPERYPQTMLSCKAKPPKQAGEYFKSVLQESADLLSTLPPEKREFRTVLVPTLVGKDDIAEIAKILPKDASWQFAQFRNENCLDPSFNNIAPYTDAELNELVDFAKTFIPGAALR